jgi:hypothetical protein
VKALLLGFHAFGNHFQTQGSAKINDRLDNTTLLEIKGSGDEPGIQLDLIKRKLCQAGD